MVAGCSHQCGQILETLKGNTAKLYKLQLCKLQILSLTGPDPNSQSVEIDSLPSRYTKYSLLADNVPIMNEVD
jgi:hypothetical protein